MSNQFIAINKNDNSAKMFASADDYEDDFSDFGFDEDFDIVLDKPVSEVIGQAFYIKSTSLKP